jgi:multidrug efflux pump subunit AcrA (membrane-fusion protein)
LANEKFQDTLIRAPQDGIVGNIDLDVGDYVSVGDTLVSITENRNLELSLAIPLARAQEAEVGTPVLVRERGQAIAGEIFFLAPQIQRDSQTMRIKAKFPNAGNKLRDGQFVRAEVIWEEIPDAIMIPTTAVVFEGDKRTVYLAEPLPEKTGSSQDSGGFELAKLLPFLPAGNGQSPTHRAVAHSVKTGLTRRDRIQITSGLEAGQKYVRAGVQKAFDGAKLIALPTSEAEN